MKKARRKNLTIFLFRKILRISPNRLSKIMDRMGKRWNEGEPTAYADLNLQQPLVMRSEWFAERVLHPYEGQQFYIPSGYDEVLTAIYGDYMQLPPKEKRITHHTFYAYDIEPGKVDEA